MGKQRQTELDILRFLSLFFVIALHTTSSVWGKIPIMSGDWIQATIWRATWPVPIFVMISGRFFLDPTKNITIKKILFKYIKRLVIAFIFWSAIYQIFYVVQSYMQGGHPLNEWKSYVFEFCQGAYHMWYLYMLAGLYLITPLVRKFAVEKNTLVYAIVTMFLYRIVVYFGQELPVIGDLINQIMGKIHLEFLSGFLIYYLLGYYLYYYDISKMKEIGIYIVGVISLIGARVADSLLAVQRGVVVEFFTNYSSPLTVIFAAAIYVFFVKRVSKIKFNEKIKIFFAETTKYGFGTYLVHALVLEIIMMFRIFQIDFIFPVIWIPVIVLIATGISFLLSVLIRKIPIMGEFVS